MCLDFLLGAQRARTRRGMALRDDLRVQSQDDAHEQYLC